ncbi:hypothetical protein TWF694_010732 [Orbilia ellipsospora]|uniref:FAD-binding domain-containing protein n=1 Tax=Orbilia ellipsospora TaxID=2528407 RepID=A0AAV9X6W5_9PEZI
MTSPAPKPVLIAGAGPTGLMAAIWLSRLKTPFRIVDKHQFAADTSRATILHARTVEFYRMLGLSDTAISEGRVIQYLSVYSDLKELVRREFGEIGAGKSKFPFVLMYPQDLNEQLMIKELEKEGVNIEREVEVTGLVQDDDGATVSLKHKDGTEEKFEASYVLGCDGGHSTVRQHTNIKNDPGTYTQRFFVADVEGEVAVGLENVNVCFTANNFCLLFSMPNGRIRLAGWAPDEIVDTKFTYADVEENVKVTTGANITKVHWFSTYQVHHGAAQTFRDNKVFICGDAAHVHSPVGGQGMNTGLGDAINITWKLAAVLSGRATPEVLETYHSERKPFADRLVNTTDKVFTIATDKGLLGKAWRTVFMGNIVPLLFHFGFMDSFLFETASQVRIEYRSSALSGNNRISNLYAGDRLPWVQFEDGSDNFEPLNSLDWQIHVYGEKNDKVSEWAQERKLGVHYFASTQDVQAKGIPKDAVLLVRPDGYIGHVVEGSKVNNLSQLQEFMDKWGIKSFSS